MKYSDKLAEFLQFLRDCQQEYQYSAELEQQANDKTQDLLHQMELGDLSYHELARLAKTLKTVRQERREAKNVTQQLQPLVDWMQTQKGVVKELERLLGVLRQKEKIVTSPRWYNSKTDIVDKTLNAKS